MLNVLDHPALRPQQDQGGAKCATRARRNATLGKGGARRQARIQSGACRHRNDT